jgi:hypothetical protein
MKECRPLILAVVEALLFLETAGSEEVNPDSAVRCMENIAASLLAADEGRQIGLREELGRIVEESVDPSYRSFVAALPDMIGLAAP